MWWARVRYDSSDWYGRWIPTGCADKQEAKDYLRINYATSGQVVEWLRM